MGNSNLPLAMGALLGGAIIVDYGTKAFKGATANASNANSTSTPSTGGSATTYTGSLPSLSEGTALTGAAATAWAGAILTAISAPLTSANIASLKDWFEHEGGGGANNPLNTTLSTSDVTDTINSAGVKSYSSPDAGVEATAKTLLGSGYSAIVSALHAGVGLSNGSSGVSQELLTWSGGGYSEL